MVRKQLILLLSVIILCLFSTYFLKFRKKVEVHKQILSQKEEVLEETRFKFKPIIEKKGNIHIITILLEITSYIYPYYLDNNYSKLAVLEIKNNYFTPTKWIIIEKNNHRVIGQLIFEINQEKMINQLSLRLFLNENHEIIWN